MRYSLVFTLTAFIGSALAAPAPTSDDGIKAALSQLAIDHPEAKEAIEVVIQAEYGGVRPAKRETDKGVKAALTQLAIDHPEVKEAVEVVILAEYGGVRPAKREI